MITDYIRYITAVIDCIVAFGIAWTSGWQEEDEPYMQASVLSPSSNSYLASGLPADILLFLLALERGVLSPSPSPV